MKQISPIITRAIGRSVEDPMQGRFYLLGQPCISISLNQEPGTADYTCSSFPDLGGFGESQFFDRQWWGKVSGWFRCSRFLVYSVSVSMVFPGGSVCRVCLQCGRPGFNRWVGKISWRRNNPLQYTCLKNSMYWGAWWATVHRVTKSWTWLSDKHLFLLLLHQLHLR